MDKYVGKRLDERYEIKELIGSGGMAMVYKAYDIIDDRIVAIKILKEEFLDNQDFIRRFKNESKAIAVLSHPNIVKVFDVSFGDIIQYIIMEYIDGITLKDYINQQKRISWKDAVYFTEQILMALKHAHAKGIIHRDIKPQNIMLLKDGTIKVTDFGIARFSRTDTRTMTDKAIGSVHYISPEQARGDVTDEKADIYSVGVMLYEMLTGKLPFEADNAVSVAIMQMQSKPKPPREINEDIPEGLEDITLKAMQKDVLNRYDSAQAMLNAIEEFKKNPSIKFEYKYLSDDSPTKYMDAIRSSRESENYGDDYNGFNKSNDNNSILSRSSKSKYMKRIIWIGASALIFAVMFGVYAISGLFKSGNKDVEVPNFIGAKWSTVENNPNYKFNWNKELVYDPNEAEGIIIDQDPKAGSKKIKENATITLKVNSSGTLVTVPSVKGTTEELAMKKIKEADLKYEVHYVEDSETAAGIVKGTNPQEGSQVKVNSVVQIFVSKGPSAKKVTMPNVINKTLEKAKNELTAKGLIVSDDSIIYQEDSQQKDKDIVLSTDPLPSVEVTEGTKVTLFVSKGQPEEKTIEVIVDLPVNVKHEVYMTVMINNIVSSEHTKKIIPAYISGGIYKIKVTGTTGKMPVVVKLDGKQYRAYEVNFDSNNYASTSAHEYEDTSSKTESETSSSESDTSSESE